MWMVLAAAAALASAAVCPESEIVNPDWRLKPDPDDMSWVYPPDAAEANMPGRATVSCEVNVEGDLENCLVISQAPQDAGFGEAALAMTGFMKMRPKTECGMRVRGNVRIPLVFSPPGIVDLPADPAALTLARRLLKVSGVESDADRTFEYELQTRYGVYEGDGSLSLEQRKAAREASKEVWATFREPYIDRLAAAYAKRLNVEEMQRAIDFYESSAGRSLTSQMRSYILLSNQSIVTPERAEEFGRRYCQKVNPCAPTDSPGEKK